jgi:hypothetical protein
VKWLGRHRISGRVFTLESEIPLLPLSFCLLGCTGKKTKSFPGVLSFSFSFLFPSGKKKRKKKKKKFKKQGSFLF